MMFKKVVLMFAQLVLLSVFLAGCNTVAGAGEDIQAGGRGIQKAANSM